MHFFIQMICISFFFYCFWKITLRICCSAIPHLIKIPIHCHIKTGILNMPQSHIRRSVIQFIIEINPVNLLWKYYTLLRRRVCNVYYIVSILRTFFPCLPFISCFKAWSIFTSLATASSKCNNLRTWIYHSVLCFPPYVLIGLF